MNSTNLFGSRNLKIFLGIAILLAKVIYGQVDPGYMFKSESESTLAKIVSSVDSSLNPFSKKIEADDSWTTDDNSCSTGTGVILKRIVKKLFTQLDQLQPNELDNEFFYHSIITYNDYLSMLNYLNDKDLDCASLHSMDKLLSSFIGVAEVGRTSQLNPFSLLTKSLFSTNQIDGLPSIDLFGHTNRWQYQYIFTVLVCVTVISWTLQRFACYSQTKSIVVGLIVVGFVQFYMQQHFLSMNTHQERIDKCMNPSYMSRILSFFNYDLNNCQSLSGPATGSPELIMANIASLSVQYLSELISQSLIPFAKNIGQASQSYLNSYSGLMGNLLGPLYLTLIYVLLSFVACFFIYYLLLMPQRGRTSRQNKPRQLNAIMNHHHRSSPKRKPLEYNNANNSSKKSNKRN